MENLEKKLAENSSKTSQTLKNEEIESAINSISEAKKLNNLNIKKLYKIYPKLETAIKEYFRENFSEKSKEIVIDISGKTFDEVKNKLTSLKVNEAYGTRVILVGDLNSLKENKALNTYLIENYKHSLCDLTWVMGKTLLENESFRDEKINRAAEVLANGYILTASGVVTNAVYEGILKVVKAETEKRGKIFDENSKIPAKIIANIINLGFLGEKDYKNVYEEFIKSNPENIKSGINQIVLGVEIKLEGLENEKNEAEKENVINSLDAKTIKVIEKAENGLALVKEVKDLNLTDEILVDDALDIKAISSEKIELDGLDGKSLRLEKLGIKLKSSIDKFLIKVGLKRDDKVLKMTESIKAFASAA